MLMRATASPRKNAEATVCTPETGFVMLELLLNMKRVSDHAQNLCEIVLGEF